MFQGISQYLECKRALQHNPSCASPTLFIALFFTRRARFVPVLSSWHTHHPWTENLTSGSAVPLYCLHHAWPLPGKRGLHVRCFYQTEYTWVLEIISDYWCTTLCIILMCVLLWWSFLAIHSMQWLSNASDPSKIYIFPLYKMRRHIWFPTPPFLPRLFIVYINSHVKVFIRKNSIVFYLWFKCLSSV